MVSAIIITKNEEKMIHECLRTLSWVEDIVIIDTGNTDKTNDIAKKHKARIIKYVGKPSFSLWRNKGLREAKGEWVLYIDADERVGSDLREEIEREIENSINNAYAIPRKNFIFGKEFKHCGQWPDYQKRLFKKSHLKGWKGEVHETPEFEGQLGHLKSALTHIKHESLSEMVEKTNDWSEIEAKLMLDAKHPPMNVARFLSAVAREFWLRMIVQVAFLDGGEGIIYGMYQVYSRFISYAKLWEMQLKKGIVS